MKIAYMMGSLNRGGAEVLMLDLFRNAKQADMDIIGIHRNTGNLYEEFINTGHKLILLRSKSLISIKYLLKLRKTIKSNSISIVHANQAVDAFRAWLACRGTKVRIVLTLHGHFYGQNWLKNTWFKWLVNSLHAVIFVSKAQFEDYRNRKLITSNKSNHFNIIYNGIDLNKIKKARALSLKEEFNLSNDALILGTVGNFGPGRDQMTICRFLKLLHWGGVDFHFFFIGGKNHREPWRYEQCVDFVKQSKIDQKVHFLGIREDVRGLLKQLKAFIYSSEHDTFGLAVIEAMAAGSHVFVNDIPVMQEITRNGELGMIYQSGNEHNLLKIFNESISGSDVINNKKAHALKYVNEKYSIVNYISSLSKLYDSLQNE
jgi:glycosyltransferase involved in cell wall biosynthesis